MKTGEISLIRQAISCDICGTEMLSANHWFVACVVGPDLRISVWNQLKRMRASARHLCGHKCLHKLVDDFMARAISAQTSAPLEADQSTSSKHTRAPAVEGLSCIAAPRSAAIPSIAAYVENFESSARITAPVVERSPRSPSDPASLRAEAWRRERERQQQSEKSARSRLSIA
jgi:hypothetical protein